MAVAHVLASAAFSSSGAANNGGLGAIGGVGSNFTFATFNYTPSGAGGLVLLWVVQIPRTISPTTCTLTATGWSFVQIGGMVDGGTAGVGALFYAFAPNTSAATITATWNQAGSTWCNILADEFSGADTISPIAGNNSATGTGTPTVSVTPAAADCMIWVACNDGISAVGSIGGTTAIKGGDDTQNDWSEYRLLTGGSGVAQSCTFSGTQTYIIGAVAIKPAGTVYTLNLQSRMCEFNVQRLA